MTQPSPSRGELGCVRAALRARHPLVHCLTNPVAANLTANALICIGASPLMAEDEGEMAAVAADTDALLVNLGMQTPPRMAAARTALAARRPGTPWVLDPVAAGALPSRTDLARDLAALGPALIKGNASEILALAGQPGSGRGTDALHHGADVLDAARSLARASGAVVAITGPVDWVVGADRTESIDGGHPAMARVSGLGCVAGALAAACLAVEADRFHATCHALAMLGRAGEQAATVAAGPGSFVPALLDALAANDAG